MSFLSFLFSFFLSPYNIFDPMLYIRSRVSDCITIVSHIAESSCAETSWAHQHVVM